jgi:hypothetical protein
MIYLLNVNVDWMSLVCRQLKAVRKFQMTRICQCWTADRGLDVQTGGFLPGTPIFSHTDYLLSFHIVRIPAHPQILISLRHLGTRILKAFTRRFLPRLNPVRTTISKPHGTYLGYRVATPVRTGHYTTQRNIYHYRVCRMFPIPWSTRIFPSGRIIHTQIVQHSA